MAVIGKIRKQSTFLLIAIGGAMVLFVLGDLLTGNSIFFSGPDTEVGVINGTKITYAEFEQRVQRALQMQFPSASPNDQQRSQVREQVWTDLIREYAYQPEFSALGIGASDNELFDVIKNDPSNPLIRQYFSNPQTGQVYDQFRSPNGQINTQAIINYFKQVLAVDPSQNPEAAGAKMSYLLFKKSLRESVVDQKFATLIQKGLYVPKSQVAILQSEKGKEVSFKFAVKYYASMIDSAYEPSESEMKAYYGAHKTDAQFQQTETVRSLDYVVFNVSPTAKDIESAENELVALKEDFKAAPDDTLFVNETSDTPFNFKWITAGQLPQAFDTIVMTAQAGEVVGPFRNGNKYELYKINTTKVGPDSAQARHILIQPTDADTTIAKALADSLLNEVNGGADFAELAQEFSVDPGSAANGGDLGWFTEGRMVKPFNDACFEGKVGDIKLVRSQFGYHVIEVTELTKPVEKVYAAIVDNNIEPLEETYQNMYNTASKFQIENKSGGTTYEEAAQDLGLMQAPALRAADRTMMGLDNSRQIVRWAYESELGDVSQVFDLGDQYVVARLNEVKEEGTLSFDQAKDLIRTEVIKEKKAEEIMADISGMNNLSDVAKKLGTPVQDVATLQFDAFSVPGVGVEPKLIGKVFTLDAGQMSVPIAGNSGVFVVQVSDYKELPSDGTEKLQLERNYQSRASFEAQNALRENASIEDKRASFY